MPADDFYRDWARTQFGEEVAAPVAELFVKLDGGPDAGKSGQSGTNLPRPSTWVHGPGGIRPDSRPWKQVRKEYRFVDELAALRSKVKGGGNLERFDYWLNSFRYLRAVGQVNCTWARFNAAMDEVKKTEDAEAKRRRACARALPIRNELVEQVEEVHRLRLATVTTTGGIGTITNWQQHLLPDLLTKPGKELADALGRELPEPAMPSTSYDGPSRLIVPTARTVLTEGEDLRLKVIIVSPNEPSGGTLFWRPLGQGAFKKKDLGHVVRSVYSVTVYAGQIEDNDIEYYVQARGGDGEKLVFPPTAPAINQTVVVLGHN
jgi:hypothetical protein